MDLHRIQLKFYLNPPGDLSPEEAFRAFSAWIPTTPDQTLIDVADYSHLPDGPLTVLVGHQANYTLDRSDRRLGLVYGRKQPLEAGLRQALTEALKACHRLEQEAELAGRVSFAGGEFQLVANDRLRAPNTESTQQAVAAHLNPVLASLYRGAAVDLTRDPDPRQRFNLLVQAGASFAVADLLRNLEKAA
ncbi:MAG: hypothetical protein IT369_20810 [Candidatus Latescibacteria bacterium]|nr:hypothetical protein [Candidatus Latescibacterota bacterium]